MTPVRTFGEQPASSVDLRAKSSDTIFWLPPDAECVWASQREQLFGLYLGAAKTGLDWAVTEWHR